VEGTSHSVSCFLWQPEHHLQNDQVKYRIQEFRQSDALQRA